MTSRNSDTAAPTFKFSGHLMDLMLRPSFPQDPRYLYSSRELTQGTRTDIGEDRSKYYSDIGLTASELKTIDVLALLLHKESQTTDPKAENYYAGNVVPLIVNHYGHKERRVLYPALQTSYYDIAKEYSLHSVGGKTLKNVKSILRGLSNKKHLMKYKEVSQGSVEDIEAFAPLITLADINDRGNVKVILNPIFRSQISKKWITYPADLMRRTEEANGSSRIKEAVLIFRNYMLRAISGLKDSDRITIRRSSILNVIKGKFISEGRQKRSQQDLELAIEVAQRMGIIQDWQEKDGKMIFRLNRRWV